MKNSLKEIEFGPSKHDFDITSCPNIIKSTKANIIFSRPAAISMALRDKQTQFDKNKLQRDCLRNMLMYLCCFVEWNKNVTPCQETLFLSRLGYIFFSMGGATKSTVIMQSGVLQADSSRYNRLFLRRFDEPSLKGPPNKWAL